MSVESRNSLFLFAFIVLIAFFYFPSYLGLRNTLNIGDCRTLGCFFGYQCQQSQVTNNWSCFAQPVSNITYVKGTKIEVCPNSNILTGSFYQCFNATIYFVDLNPSRPPEYDVCILPILSGDVCSSTTHVKQSDVMKTFGQGQLPAAYG